MDKNKYYISVQSRSIMREQGHAAYELEIEATEDEVQQLQTLFETLEEADHAANFRAWIPGIPYHHDPENDMYDSALRDCYNYIRDLGTDETKSHISAIADDLNHMGHRWS